MTSRYIPKLFVEKRKRNTIDIGHVVPLLTIPVSQKGNLDKKLSAVCAAIVSRVLYFIFLFSSQMYQYLVGHTKLAGSSVFLFFSEIGMFGRHVASKRDANLPEIAGSARPRL